MTFSWSPLKIQLLPLEILDKTKLYFWKFCKIALYTLITPGNCTSFSVDPYNLNMKFLQYPRKFHVLNPPPPAPIWISSSLSLYIYSCLIILKKGKFWRGAEPPSDETMVQKWRGPNKEVFHLIHKENITKTMEASTSGLDTVKLCASKYYIER